MFSAFSSTNKRHRTIENEAENNVKDFHNTITDTVNCYRSGNKIYFCDQINWNSVFVLNKMLRDLQDEIINEGTQTKSKLPSDSLYCNVKIEPIPIMLYLTTYGGIVHAAWSVVDTIQTLSVPVYSIIDGFVASAGTIISMAAERRFIRENAYLLIHEIRSGIWGKYGDIIVEKDNADKIMNHIIDFYLSRNVKLSRDELATILSKDIVLNANDALEKGLVDQTFTKETFSLSSSL